MNSAALPNNKHGKNPARWLTVEQLMELLPLKRSRIYYLTHIRAIPHHKIGQTLFFREDEILKWMEDNRCN